MLPLAPLNALLAAPLLLVTGPLKTGTRPAAHPLHVEREGVGVRVVWVWVCGRACVCERERERV